jgi:hypothetical protein
MRLSGGSDLLQWEYYLKFTGIHAKFSQVCESAGFNKVLSKSTAAADSYCSISLSLNPYDNSSNNHGGSQKFTYYFRGGVIVAQSLRTLHIKNITLAPFPHVCCILPLLGLMFGPEDGDSMFLQNIDNLLQDYQRH